MSLRQLLSSAFITIFKLFKLFICNYWMIWPQNYLYNFLIDNDLFTISILAFIFPLSCVITFKLYALP